MDAISVASEASYLLPTVQNMLTIAEADTLSAQYMRSTIAHAPGETKPIFVLAVVWDMLKYRFLYSTGNHLTSMRAANSMESFSALFGKCTYTL